MRRIAAVIAMCALVQSAAAQEPPDQPDNGRTLRAVGATAMGTGAALGVATLALLFYARDARDRIEGLSATFQHEWDPPDQALWDKAERADDIAKVTAVAAGVTFVTGAVIYFLGWRADDTQVTVTPLPGGAAMGVTCAF